MNKNRLTPSEQAKIDWVDSLCEHHIGRTGGFQTCLRRGLKLFGEEWKEHVRCRNAKERREGRL